MTPERLQELNHETMEAMKSASYKTLHVLDDNSTKAVEVNRQLLARLLDDNKQTEFGRAHGFAKIKNADQYRAQVPLSTYDDYEDAITRMTEKGEHNLITAYPVVYYASTSGTTSTPKKIPVSDRGLKAFQDYGVNVMPAILSEFYRTTRLHDIPDGFFVQALNYSKTPLPDGTMFGCISAACMDEDKMKVLPYFMSTPVEAMMLAGNTDHKYLHARFGLARRDVVYLMSGYIPALLDLAHYIRDEWPRLVRDIREGTIGSDVVMPDSLRKHLQADLEPDPERADELEREFAKGFDDAFLARIWPKLSAVSAIWAGNFASYARKLQAYTGRSIPYYTLSYTSSEAIFGAARHPHDQYYIMLPDSCFFEFIPMDGKDDQSGQENPKTVLIDEVEENKDYELVITNQSGFYRYRMGDVIRVIGFYNEAPMITFKYRLKNVVSLVGEKFTEDHLLFAVREFERHTGVNVIDYCLYPDRDAAPCRYVVFLEPDEPVAPEKKEEYVQILKRHMMQASTSFAHYVQEGTMGDPKLVFLQQETFQFYRELKMYRMGINENQLKTVRVLTTPELISFFTHLEEK